MVEEVIESVSAEKDRILPKERAESDPMTQDHLTALETKEDVLLETREDLTPPETDTRTNLRDPEDQAETQEDPKIPERSPREETHATPEIAETAEETTHATRETAETNLETPETREETTAKRDQEERSAQTEETQAKSLYLHTEKTTTTKELDLLMLKRTATQDTRQMQTITIHKFSALIH